MGPPKGAQRQRPLTTKSKFTPEEDELLKKLVEEYGTLEWSKIASMMPGRSGRQCRDRWSNYIDPNIIQTPWTKQEDADLLRKYHEIGAHWRILANCFPGRSINGVRNRVVKLTKSEPSDSKKKTKKTISRVKVESTESEEEPSSTSQSSDVPPPNESSDVEQVNVNENVDFGEFLSNIFDVFGQVSEVPFQGNSYNEDPVFQLMFQ